MLFNFTHSFKCKFFLQYLQVGFYRSIEGCGFTRHAIRCRPLCTSRTQSLLIGCNTKLLQQLVSFILFHCTASVQVKENKINGFCCLLFYLINFTCTSGFSHWATMNRQGSSNVASSNIVLLQSGHLTSKNDVSVIKL